MIHFSGCFNELLYHITIVWEVSWSAFVVEDMIMITDHDNHFVFCQIMDSHVFKWKFQSLTHSHAGNPERTDDRVKKPKERQTYAGN